MAEEVCDCKKFRPPALRRMEKLIRLARRTRTDLVAPIADHRVGPEIPKELWEADDFVDTGGIFSTKAAKEALPRGLDIAGAEIATMMRKPAPCFCIGSADKGKIDVECYSPSPRIDYSAAKFLYTGVLRPSFEQWWEGMKKKYKTDKPEEMGERMSPEDRAAARKHIDNFDYLMKSMEEDVKPLLPSCKIILTRK